MMKHVLLGNCNATSSWLLFAGEEHRQREVDSDTEYDDVALEQRTSAGGNGELHVTANL